MSNKLTQLLQLSIVPIAIPARSLALNRCPMILALIVCLGLPSVAVALDLQWSSGASAVSSVSAVQCTLIVHASAGEGTLPSEWRLVWVGTRCEDLKPELDTSSTVPTVARVD